MSGEKKIDMEELAKAFDNDEKETKDEDKKVKKKKSPKNKKVVAVFVVGIIALVGGLSFLIYKLVAGPSMADAEFLTSVGLWVEEDEPSVIWNFTEVGKGKLTTDNHQTDYDFIWALDGNKLKIEAKWLYDLSDEFEYSLDQGDKVLTLKNDGIEVKFKGNQ